MNAETKNCQNCKSPFTIEPEDFNFYEKVKVPPPTFCPECRLIRRMVYRNERALYKRKCDLCGQERILFLSQGTKFPVYCRECWWGDTWDAKNYGRDYDFSRPFFEQFQDLFNTVPRPGTVKQGNSIDSEYTNRVTDMRGCYLIFGTTIAEYCRYGVWLNESKECMDCYSAQKSERCYECIDCFQCYNIRYAQESIACRDSAFLYNCRDCQSCFGCVNLRGKSYCIFNLQYSKEEYQKKVAQYQLGSSMMVEGVRNKFNELKKKCIVPALVTHHSSNVSGNWIERSKNIFRSFNCLEIEDARYCYNLIYGKDVMDFGPWSNHSERIYEAINVGMQCADMKFAHECWSQVIQGEYVMNCHNAQNLFGCVGLRGARYCILNKEYSKEEYETLVRKIREHMDEMPYRDRKGRTYKYGEFFPVELSPHAYNETLAQEFFPITKEEAMEKGYPWKDPEAKMHSVTLRGDDVPDNIDGVEDGVLNETIGCTHKGACTHQCTVAFRIIPDELQFYRNFKIPLPRFCPNCRHYERLKQRNPLKLWHRSCHCAGEKSENGVYSNTGAHPSHAKGEPCPNEFETSYAPERPEIVYCESCYQNEVA
ncbi:MAG: hypothetical protein A2946_03910 [Candidatus Liptonbacteria bacterium RIFCSPLOWO2_01_FULL_53_13]|uniref:Zinc-binding domain-containing protein n=2 Tax=Parcubacteria group TaxID=1794811 RepID=A0A1G2CHK3_9BACT|nr:MAG: hypothetical protein A2946_03910 [Candidatus Liptonbacteria bacterium RIFCSPLOWO2_01_FULL_53_13]